MEGAAQRSVKENPAKTKSYSFALRIIRAYQHLVAEQKEWVLSKQLLRSGTSIGANIAEANEAQSRADFISKLGIALKETVETEYWLSLLRDANYLTTSQVDGLLVDCREIKAILTASIKSTKRNS